MTKHNLPSVERIKDSVTPKTIASLVKGNLKRREPLTGFIGRSQITVSGLTARQKRNLRRLKDELLDSDATINGRIVTDVSKAIRYLLEHIYGEDDE